MGIRRGASRDELSLSEYLEFATHCPLLTQWCDVFYAPASCFETSLPQWLQFMASSQ